MWRAVFIMVVLTEPVPLLATKSGLPEGAGPDTFFPHAGAKGTEHNRDKNDKDFFKTNSEMPLLPTIHGFTGTHGIIDQLSINYQLIINYY